MAYASTMLHDTEKGVAYKPEENFAKSQKRGVTIRLKIAEHLEADETWKEGFAQRPDATSETEDGAPAATAAEFIGSTKRAKKWLDWKMISAAAAVLQRDILIFIPRGKTWTMRARATNEKDGYAINTAPIVLLLA